MATYNQEAATFFSSVFTKAILEGSKIREAEDSPPKKEQRRRKDELDLFILLAGWPEANLTIFNCPSVFLSFHFSFLPD